MAKPNEDVIVLQLRPNLVTAVEEIIEGAKSIEITLIM